MNCPICKKTMIYKGYDQKDDGVYHCPECDFTEIIKSKGRKENMGDWLNE